MIFKNLGMKFACLTLFLSACNAPEQATEEQAAPPPISAPAPQQRQLVSEHALDSAVISEPAKYYVFLPPSYDTS